MEFKLASKNMLNDIYKLYVKRIEWMEQTGIKAWNVRNYLETYPREYFSKQIDKGRLYVLTNKNKVIGSLVLLETDPRWGDNKGKEYYIHNLVSDINYKGLGTHLLDAVQNLAKENGKTKVRLDCAIDNTKLNKYYEKLGFMYVGKCKDGLYQGIKREKNIN